ncbi:hypothetical protein [Dyella sp. 20L07]|uniref:hypothetical protein n=1 Tax=Dyella sp. 20L07 TaxID=3384240 RepID=UPI003D2B3EFD
MKRYVAFATLVTLLAGCSSAGSLRNSKPTASYAGSGSVGDIASCISGAWAEKPVHLSSYELYTGTTIEIHQTENGPSVALVDIKAVSDRTVATYYSNFNEDDTWYFQQVERCVDITPPKE